jgi:hypothetical protein
MRATTLCLLVLLSCDARKGAPTIDAAIPDGAPYGTCSSAASVGNPELTAIWGLAPDDFFVVGPFQFVYHVQGSSGTWIPGVEDTKNGARLLAIWGSGSSDIYTVGTQGAMLHFDGASWSGIAVGTFQSLRGIWGADAETIFVVGDSGTILRREGGLWIPMQSGTSKNLYAVWGAGPADVYAVGGEDSETPVVLHFDGQAWTSQPVPGAHGLRAVWGASATSVFAAGRDGVLRSDGGSWSKLPLELPAGAGLLALSGSGPNDVVAAGHPVRDGDPSLVLHFDGGRWAPCRCPGNAYLLSGVWGDGQRGWYFVGREGALLKLVSP